MRNVFLSVLAAAILLTGVSVAKADVLSVYADLPMQATLKFEGVDGNQADSVSGIKVGVTLPFFIGFGLESYSIQQKNGGDDYGISMLDVFANLPVPFVNIALGIGVGSGKLGGNASDAYDDAALTQFWGSVGIPILEVFDVHLGYHSFKGRHASKHKDLYSDVNVEGTMISLGGKVGF